MKHLLLLNMLRNCLVVLLFVFTTNIHAIEVENLYSAKVVIASQSTADRNKALRAALKAVVLKVGGKEIQHPIFSQALRNYNQYVSQFRYLRENDQLFINVSFNETKINDLFKQSDSAIWGQLRPQVVVWLIKENNLEREVISATSETSYPQMVASFSEQRGLPLLMPLMDLTDLTALSIADLWGRFSQPIRLASQRYAAEAVVVVRISNNSLLPEQDDDCEAMCANPDVTLDWSLMPDINNEYTQVFSERYQGSDSAALLNQALTNITELIYQQYALSTDSSNEFEIDVANIATLTQLMEVTSFLEELSAVESVQLVQAKGENRRFKLSLIGTQQALLASLKLSGQISQYIDPLAGPAEPNQAPIFYWGSK